MMIEAGAPRMTALTAAQMVHVDRVMVEELGLDVLQLMEVAGKAVARFARDRFLDGDARQRRVLVLAGSGGNGGDGLVAARYLHGWGAGIEVQLSHAPERPRGATKHNLTILERLGLPVRRPPADGSEVVLPGSDLIVDALLGFGLAGAPTGVTAALIEAANAIPTPVLAVDLPSGLDATSGLPYLPCVRAAATLTLALPKTGLLTPTATEVVGEVHVADIGVPELAYAAIGVTVGPVFGGRDIVRWPDERG